MKSNCLILDGCFFGVFMHFRQIKNLREDHDLTQEEVAKLLHCHRGVYQRHESGIREIPVSYAIVLAKYYGVTLDFLLQI